MADLRPRLDGRRSPEGVQRQCCSVARNRGLEVRSANVEDTHFVIRTSSFALLVMLIEYRHLTLDDVPAGLRLCRIAGWNQLAADWELFLRLSPGGCRAAVCDGNVV